jgi:hypothetical protein
MVTTSQSVTFSAAGGGSASVSYGAGSGYTVPTVAVHYITATQYNTDTFPGTADFSDGTGPHAVSISVVLNYVSGTWYATFQFTYSGTLWTFSPSYLSLSNTTPVGSYYYGTIIVCNCGGSSSSCSGVTLAYTYDSGSLTSVAAGGSANVYRSSDQAINVTAYSSIAIYYTLTGFGAITPPIGTAFATTYDSGTETTTVDVTPNSFVLTPTAGTLSYPTVISDYSTSVSIPASTSYGDADTAIQTSGLRYLDSGTPVSVFTLQAMGLVDAGGNFRFSLATIPSGTGELAITSIVGYPPCGDPSSSAVASTLSSSSTPCPQVDLPTLCEIHCFELGACGSWRAPCDGVLYLTYNDTFYPDNTGTFTVEWTDDTGTTTTYTVYGYSARGTPVGVIGGVLHTYTASGSINNGGVAGLNLWIGGPNGVVGSAGRGGVWNCRNADYASLFGTFIPDFDLPNSGACGVGGDFYIFVDAVAVDRRTIPRGV